MMIPRVYQLEKLFKPGRVIVLYGPRRVGKTTLVKNFLRQLSQQEPNLKYKATSGDDLMTRDILSSQSRKRIQRYVAGYDLIVIDEAQRIPDVGWGLKLMVDHNPDLKVLITGSASLDLSYKVGEPLVGRKLTYDLYPLAQSELLAIDATNTPNNCHELEQQKEDLMIYGSYPEVLLAETEAEKRQLLTELVQSQMLKDIFDLEQIRKPRVIFDLLKLIAFQVGSEVSLTELGQSLAVDKKTVRRYLWLLEQTFVLQRLSGFSRNLRKEITKMDKYYFVDNGVRNAVINNFNRFDTRNDVGQLWENFLVTERLKKQAYAGIQANNYFWRTWEQHEVDWVEERGGKLYGYEFKWGRNSSERSKKKWLGSYVEAEYQVVRPENYLEFLL